MPLHVQKLFWARNFIFIQEGAIDHFVIYSEELGYSHMKELISESLYGQHVEQLERSAQVVTVIPDYSVAKFLIRVLILKNVLYLFWLCMRLSLWDMWVGI